MPQKPLIQKGRGGTWMNLWINSMMCQMTGLGAIEIGGRVMCETPWFVSSFLCYSPKSVVLSQSQMLLDPKYGFCSALKNFFCGTISFLSPASPPPLCWMTFCPIIHHSELMWSQLLSMFLHLRERLMTGRNQGHRNLCHRSNKI